jgi:hypothetical protein
MESEKKDDSGDKKQTNGERATYDEREWGMWDFKVELACPVIQMASSGDVFHPFTTPSCPPRKRP